MSIRTTKARTQPGQVDEFVRRWRELVAPRVPEMSGRRGVYLCADRDANTVVTIHLWDTPRTRRPTRSTIGCGSGTGCATF